MNKTNLANRALAVGKALGPLIFIAVLISAAIVIDGWGVKWVRGEYRALVNAAQLVQTGETIRTVMARYTQSDRHLVQPFLDRYSPLLDDLVAMERGKEGMGFTPIADVFPEGSAQPAWATLVRSGSIHISSDGKGRVRVFLPVERQAGKVDAEYEYSRRYSVLRHPLAWLSANNNGAPLDVEVFCFNNDYRTLALNLSMQTHAFSESNFPSRHPFPLNLTEIEGVLARAAKIKASRLADGALELVAVEGRPATIAGTPISLSDLAVAYRACFHSGANEPYVSLDPHRIPTKVTVNFGGYLEDTRIGSVLLESDKRFKSISTGLSPDGIADIAALVKEAAPGFMPKDERSFLQADAAQSGWKGTRFWFYPDSITLETELSGSVAVISSPRFTADAERSMDDVLQLGLAKESAKSLLAPETREAINQLNSDYDRLATVFPELRELDTVGELMGLFVWAKRSQASGQVDLDALLAVELPAFSTPRDKSQLISTSICVTNGRNGVKSFSIRRTAFTDQLNRKFRDICFTPEEYTALSANNGTVWDVRRDINGAWIGIDSEKAMHELLSTEAVVQNFAKIMAKRFSESLDDKSGEQLLDRMATALKERKDQIDLLKRRMEALERAGAIEQFNALVPVFNELVEAHKAEVASYNVEIGIYNSRPFASRTITHIGGGISVRPSSFKMSTVGSSPQLDAAMMAFQTRQAPEGMILSARGAARQETPRICQTLPPSSWTRHTVQSGTRSSSAPPIGVARDKLLPDHLNVLTAIKFYPDGSQETHTVSRSEAVNDVAIYTFNRIPGTRYTRPTVTAEK